MKKILALVLGFCLAGVSSHSQMTLSQAADLALKNNKGIRSSAMKIEAKNTAVTSAYGRYFPQIAVDFTYTHMDKDLVLDLNPIRKVLIEVQSGNQVGFSNLESLIKSGKTLTPEQQAAVKSGAQQKLNASLPEFKETLKEQTFPAMMLTLQQPLFTGGKILAGVRAAEAQKRMEIAKAEGESQEVLFSVINYYLNVLLAEENYKVRVDALETVKKHNERAQSLLAQGLIANHDKLRADVALSEAERNLFEASEKRNIAKMALKTVLESHDEINDLGDKLIYKVSNSSLDEFLSLAKQDNAQIRQIRAGSDALVEKANVEYGDFFPTIFGYGFYNCFDHYIIPEAEPKWGLGIGAHFNVFDGLRNYNNYQESKAEADAVKLMSEEVENKIGLLVRNNYMEMRLAEEQYKRLSTTLEQALENRKLNSKRFEAGLGTSLEALDAQLTYEGVELKRLQALKDYYTSMAKIYQNIASADKFLTFWQN